METVRRVTFRIYCGFEAWMVGPKWNKRLTAASLLCTQALAKVVANHFGGTYDTEEALERCWLASSAAEKNIRRSVVILLGRLRVGAARHRALLFKVTEGVRVYGRVSVRAFVHVLLCGRCQGGGAEGHALCDECLCVAFKLVSVQTSQDDSTPHDIITPTARYQPHACRSILL